MASSGSVPYSSLPHFWCRSSETRESLLGPLCAWQIETLIRGCKVEIDSLDCSSEREWALIVAHRRCAVLTHVERLLKREDVRNRPGNLCRRHLPVVHRQHCH